MDETTKAADEAQPTSSDYLSEVSFADLPLSEPMQRAIEARGYRHPTPVQSQAIPEILEGRDLIVRSKTGTGKTAAFSIPIVERIPKGARKPLALVLCPTRELALQVSQELEALSKGQDLRVAAIYGGASMSEQVRALEEGAEIVVGTPGRVYDHIRRRTLKLDEAQIAVLDEADEMLSMGFFEEVTRILDKLPKERQTLLFSATLSPDIERLISKYLVDPKTLLLSGDTYTVEGIEHVYYEVVEGYPKPRNLLYLLELENPESAIIFANTRDDVSLLNAVLNRNGYDAEELSGELPQRERERVMAKVKRGEVRYMVATDLAARGIDISDLSHVINYSLPEDPAVYLHRVGRTGRIGKTGTAISLVGGRDRMVLDDLARQFDIEFVKRTLPTPEEAGRLWVERHLVELRKEMGQSVFEAYLPLARELRTRPDGELLMAAALKAFFANKRKERAEQAAAREEEERGAESRERGRKRGRRERREREPRAAREPHEERPREERAAAPQETEAAEEAEKGVKLYVSLGTEDELDEAGIRKTILDLAGAEEASILRLEVKDSFSFFTVDKDAAAAFLSANGAQVGEKELRVERAKGGRRRRFRRR